MAYGDFKDFAKRAASDRILRDKAFNIAKSSKYDGYQRGLASMVYKFFDQKSALLRDKSVSGNGIVNNNNNNDNNNNNNDNNNIKQNLQLSEELYKPIIRKFKKRKVYSGFRDNIWGTGLADMQLISKFNKGYRFLLCVIDRFSKYAWVIPFKDIKGVLIANAFQKILKESDRSKAKSKGRKPNKIWVDKRSEFYDNYFKK